MWKWEAEGQPKAVVMIIHSAYEHHRRYAWLTQKLRNSGFHVVTGDLPGHGEGTGRRTHDEAFEAYHKHIKRMAEVALLDNLPLFILGHGLGATLAIQLLSGGKVECAGCILSSPWLALRHQPPKYKAMLTKLSPSMKVNHGMAAELLTRNSELYIEANEDRDYSSAVTAVWYRDLLAQMKSITMQERTIQNIPVLLHAGGRDKITYIETSKKWLLKQDLTEFHYKEWKRLYHDLYQEPERDEVFTYIESFMDNVLRGLGYVV